MSAEEFQKAPAPESCRLISFDDARIERGGFPGNPTLIVRGEAPCLNMSVFLSPRVYVRCPEWWGVEVVGCLPGGICLTALKPYEVSIPLGGITGSRGIEVIGAQGSRQIESTGGCKSHEQSA